MTQEEPQVAPSPEQRPTIMLIDGYGLIFRAYHAIQTSMSTAAGEPTNAVYGFASMLLNVLSIEKPDYAIVALEAGPTFRHEVYAEYKGTRAEFPDELRPQVVRIRELIDAFSIPIAQQPRYEADDVIGSLSVTLPRDHGLQVVVLTGDTDLLQLVDEHVEVVLPGGRRFDEFRRYNREAVIERYGFGPELIPDYKALVGDTSDNIPGVAGIGEKTATSLILSFGGVEEILANVPAVEPARARNALEQNGEKARESRFLTQIVRDLEVPVDLPNSRIDFFDRDTVVEKFRELEFRSLLTRLPESKRPRQPVAIVTSDPVRTTVTTVEELEHLIARLREAGEFAIDVQTTDASPLRSHLIGIAIAVDPEESFYIPIAAGGSNSLTLEVLQEKLAPVLSDPELRTIAHQAKFDTTILERYGLPVTNLAFDTMLAAFLLGESSMSLKDLAFTKLGQETTQQSSMSGNGRGQLAMDVDATDDVAQSACCDVEVTLALKRLFAPRLESDGQLEIFDQIEMPLIPVLQDMETTGVAVDADYLTAFSVEMTSSQRTAEEAIYRIAGREFNINSTRQLASLLFEELKLPSGRKTKSGYSVDQEVLESAREDHEIIDHILEYRSLGKLLSTYVDALPREVNPQTGRVHTSYNQAGAATGRLSSNNPNLQNIPIRTELGRRVRKAFVADQRPEFRLFDDAVLISADYSQIELRLMAHMSDEPFLIEAFRNEQDVHRATAALVNDVPLEQVTPDMRRVAKTVNFGLLYGMQAFGLSRDTGMSRADSQAFVDAYWARLPKVKAFIDSIIELGRQRGYVETLSGRRRAMPDLLSSNPPRRAAAVRIATNMPLQGTAADIMKIAMVDFHTKLEQSGLRAKMLLQVHDELVVEAERSDLEPVARLLTSSMSNAYQISVPLITEVSYGQNWDDQTELNLN